MGNKSKSLGHNSPPGAKKTPYTKKNKKRCNTCSIIPNHPIYRFGPGCSCQRQRQRQLCRDGCKMPDGGLPYKYDRPYCSCVVNQKYSNAEEKQKARLERQRQKKRTSVVKSDSLNQSPTVDVNVEESNSAEEVEVDQKLHTTPLPSPQVTAPQPPSPDSQIPTITKPVANPQPQQEPEPEPRSEPEPQPRSQPTQLQLHPQSQSLPIFKPPLPSSASSSSSSSRESSSEPDNTFDSPRKSFTLKAITPEFYDDDRLPVELTESVIYVLSLANHWCLNRASQAWSGLQGDFHNLARKPQLFPGFSESAVKGVTAFVHALWVACHVKSYPERPGRLPHFEHTAVRNRPHFTLFKVWLSKIWLPTSEDGMKNAIDKEPIGMTIRKRCWYPKGWPTPVFSNIRFDILEPLLGTAETKKLIEDDDPRVTKALRVIWAWAVAENALHPLEAFAGAGPSASLPEAGFEFQPPFADKALSDTLISTLGRGDISTLASRATHPIPSVSSHLPSTPLANPQGSDDLPTKRQSPEEPISPRATKKRRVEFDSSSIPSDLPPRPPASSSSLQLDEPVPSSPIETTRADVEEKENAPDELQMEEVPLMKLVPTRQDPHFMTLASEIEYLRDYNRVLLETVERLMTEKAGCSSTSSTHVGNGRVDLTVPRFKHYRHMLHSAVSNDSIREVKKLLEEGADIAVKDQQGSTALHIAVEQGYKEMVKLLLTEGADVAAVDQSGRTALHRASERGWLEIVKLLLEQSSDITTADTRGMTALHRASEGGHTEIVRLLLEEGADVKAANNTGWTALHYAHGNWHVEIAKSLLAQGANIAAVDQHGRTPLHCAVDVGGIEMVKLLLEHGADISLKDNSGYDCLALAKTGSSYISSAKVALLTEHLSKQEAQ